MPYVAPVVRNGTNLILIRNLPWLKHREAHVAMALSWNNLLSIWLYFHRGSVEEDLQEAGTLQTITICILTLVLFISPFIIFLVRNATQTIQTFASGLVSKTTELKRERKRCDRLLCQMLPKAVVRQLKQRRQVLIQMLCRIASFVPVVVTTNLAY